MDQTEEENKIKEDENDLFDKHKNKLWFIYFRLNSELSLNI